MRNGPNPLFKPIYYSYPMDGDGMIHAVYFDNGQARYRNRFVQTSGLVTERRAGRAIYGSLTHPVPIDPALIGPGGNPDHSKTAHSSVFCDMAVICSHSTKRLPAMN